MKDRTRTIINPTDQQIIDACTDIETVFVTKRQRSKSIARGWLKRLPELVNTSGGIVMTARATLGDWDLRFYNGPILVGPKWRP